MSVLIKQAKVISPGSSFHNKILDILVENGVITEIKKTITTKTNAKIIDIPGQHVSIGWVDMQTVSCDPGFEHKENLESLITASASGGFTTICVHNYNQPAIHNKSLIEYILNKTQNKVVSVLPFGTITVDGKGNDMAEMFDMKQSGAIAFSDHKHPIKDAGVVLRSLQYASNIGSFIITHCNDQSISQGGQINEGETATSLGLKGIPALAEELMLQRNLAILEYTGGRLHIPTISTKGSVEMIKKAKSNGLQVTAGVAAVNLMLDDSELAEFDTNYKLDPPLRTKKDVQALCNAVISGVIDVIVSDHLPQDIESKALEFDLAENGIINAQTAFNCALAGLKDKNIEALVLALTENPREILGLSIPKIKEMEPANLTIFCVDGETVFSEKSNFSKSRNSPFFDESLQGRVIGIVNGTKTFFNHLR
jgi:dihydroorotase